jgi:hypothetical protein
MDGAFWHAGALVQLTVRASSFETARSLSSGAHSRDPLAPPQDEVQQLRIKS